MTTLAAASASIALETKPADAGDTNRQWIHVLPKGTFYGKDGRGPYTCADPAIVIEASRQRAGTNQIPVDYDHQSVFGAVPGVGGKAPAAGWISGMQARADGIWALVTWTAKAAAHIAAKEYRYLSPVFQHDRDGNIAAIVSVGLLNSPNLGQLTAVASARLGVSEADWEQGFRETLAGLDAAKQAHEAVSREVLADSREDAAKQLGAPSPRLTEGAGGSGFLPNLQARWARSEREEAEGTALQRGEPSSRLLESFHTTDHPSAVAGMETRMEDTFDLKTLVAELRKLLGLADDADTNAIIAGLRDAMTGTAAMAATPDPAKYVPIGEFTRVVQEVKRLNAGISKDAAELAVASQIAAKNLPPFLADWGKALCSVNKPAFDAFITEIGPSTRALFESQIASAVHARGRGGALSETELAVCAQMGLTPQELIDARAFSDKTGVSA